jgi:hypothetical protein
MLTLKEFGQLKKFMMLTTSENDNEAVAALRRANAILAAHTYTWDAVFARLVKIDNQVEDASTYDNPARDASDRKQRIKEALEVAMRDASGSFKQFLDDLSDQFERKGYLSQAQYEAVIKSARRAGWQG